MRRLISAAAALFAASLPATAFAADAAMRKPSTLAIAMFLLVMLSTLAITWWAARRIKTRQDFYAAGGQIRGWQNGLAISGDFMSAATILGVTGLMYTTGFDSMIYILGPLVGFSVLIFLMAERFRNLGKYTFTDVASFRLEPVSMKAFGACGTLVVVIFYMIAQMVGAGALIEVLFHVNYAYAVILVGVLMILYVSLGGMLATTWVQIVKAVLLIFATIVITLLVLWHFGFSLEAMFRGGGRGASQAHGDHGAGRRCADLISVGIALHRGQPRRDRPAPYPDAILHRAGFQGSAHLDLRHAGHRLPRVLRDLCDRLRRDRAGDGQAGIHRARRRPDRRLQHGVGASRRRGGRRRLFRLHLGRCLRHHPRRVAGLTLAGASAVSHDLYGQVFRKGQASEKEEVMVSRIAAICVGIVAVFFGIVFEKQNVAFMVSLGLSVAASANFPVLILSMYWKGLTTRGAFIGGFAGLISAVVLVALGPVVWVQILGHAKPIFPYAYPALHSMMLAFICIWFFSVTDRSKRAAIDREGFEVQNVRSQTGIGAEGAVEH